MKRIVLIRLLALGAVGGFGSGIASIHRMRHHREDFEKHVATVCVEAAEHSHASQVK